MNNFIHLRLIQETEKVPKDHRKEVFKQLMKPVQEVPEQKTQEVPPDKQLRLELERELHK